MVQTGKDRKVLKVKLTPELLKKFGVRGESATKRNNEVVSVDIRNVLKKNESYDLYCHSEVSGDLEKLSDDHMNREIQNSRFRFDTDVQPPELQIVEVVPSFHSITVRFKVEESVAVWCLAIKLKSNEEIKDSRDPLFDSPGALEVNLHSYRYLFHFCLIPQKL